MSGNAPCTRIRDNEPVEADSDRKFSCTVGRVDKIWLKLGTVLTKIVNPIVLALLFFLVLTPIALVMRIVGKRPLCLEPDQTAATYWIEREPSTSGSSSMRRQF